MYKHRYLMLFNLSLIIIINLLLYVVRGSEREGKQIVADIQYLSYYFIYILGT